MNRTDLIAEIIRTEQIAQAARDRASELRKTLASDATAEYHEQGTAPTWRGEYGVVTLPITRPSIEVQDPDRLVAWCAEHHPTEVETVRRVREAYLSYIRQHYVMDSDADGLPVVLDPTTQEPVDGLTWQPGGQPGALSIRPTPAAKRQARQYAEQRLRALTDGEA